MALVIEEAKKKIEEKYGLVYFDETKEDEGFYYFICKKSAPSLVITVNKKTGKIKREKSHGINIIL